MPTPDIELAHALHARMMRDGLTQRQVAEHAGASHTTIQRMLSGKPVSRKTGAAVRDWLAKDATGTPGQPPITRDPVALAIHRAGPIAREVAVAAVRSEHKHRKERRA